MASIVVRNIPEDAMNSLKARARANKRKTEAEVREILVAAAIESEKTRPKIGSELAAIGRAIGGVDLDIRRDPSPIEPADFS